MSTHRLRADVTKEALNARGAGYLPGLFGIEIVALEAGNVNARLAIRPDMLAPNGFLHAATVIALADTCAGYATIAHLPVGSESFTTIELKSNFFATATEGWLQCVATAVHTGRATQVWDAEVSNEAGKRLALFRCTQMVLWPKGGN